MKFDLIFLLIFTIVFAFMIFCMAKIEDERGMKITMYCGSVIIAILAIVIGVVAIT